MLNQSNRRTLKTSLMAGAAVATVAGFTSVAQADDASKVEKVTVTGSRIPQKGLTSVSPVSTISSVEAKLTGTTSAETLLNDMPQVFANQGAEVSNGSSGTATVDLRQLGPQRTLVLVNGRRLTPANIAAPTADLNNIPIAMIDRVEVLTGGASATYGADAVAGVVNFIYRKNVEGLYFGGTYGINDHDNDDEFFRSIQDDAGFPKADEHVNDGRVTTLWGLIGASSGDGKGNVTAYIQYRNAQALLQSERDFSNCAIANGSSAPPPANLKDTFNCQGSSNGPTGRFNVVGDDIPTRFTANSSAAGTMRAYDGSIDTFNFNPTNYLQRPDDRYLIGATARYELAPDLEFYSELSFMDDRTVAQIAASGFFAGSGPVGGNFSVNCDNPLLTGNGSASIDDVQATPFNVLCGDQRQSFSVAGPVTFTLANPLGTTGTATVNIGRRFVETNLGRQDDFQSTSYRTVAGFKGQIEDWDYDVFAQYGTTTTPRAYLNDVSRTRAQRALNVVIDTRPGSPTLGQPVCSSVIDGSDTSCLPANIFSFGELSGAAIAYMSATGIQKTTTEEQVVNASTNGEFGFGLPWATDNIQAALGAEYRWTSLNHIADDVFASGDLLGQGGSTPNTSGHYDVWEAFGEVQIPLVQDRPFAKLLEINAGYRLSDYDSVGITHTYKYAGSWMPTDDLRLRASFQRAVRAPNVVELFTPQAQGLWGGTDPCSLTSSSSPGTNFYNAAQCANTGLSGAQFAAFTSSGAFQCPAAQCSGPFSGNANLKPESSDTKSFGVVLTPSFLKGFNASVDYYDIKIDDTIRIISQTAILGNCAQTGNAFACSLVNRDPVTGALFNSATLGVGVDSQTRNSGTQTSKGIDVDVNYKLDLDDAGSLTLGVVGSYYDSAETNYGPGFETFECVGFYGLVCGNPTPEWKHRLRTTWASPWDVDFSFAWRHISDVKLDVNDPTDVTFGYLFNGPLGDVIDASIPSYDYFDLSFNWVATDQISITGGIKNIGDKDPPVVDSQTFGISSPPYGNANTYPAVYDAFGREVFISMSTKF
ncbi:MAG: TonB-dependent receptor [Alphaproteobacteria bacterium]|nr:TonB-dependent receptor [Alphaproteobacteria bacterium]